MKIYTRTGDSGETGLLGGKRISKDSLEICALGSLDELNAIIGVSISFCKFKDIIGILTTVQNDLFNVGSEIAVGGPARHDAQGVAGGGVIKNPRYKFKLGKSKVTDLEKQIDKVSNRIDELRNFILPGGPTLTSLIHFSRAIARRTEREIVALSKIQKINPNVLMYINRLSDLLFVLARLVNKLENVPDTKWVI